VDIIYKLARNIVDTRYEDIPKEAIEIEKLDVLDQIGCLLSGATQPGCEALVEYVKEMGGREESTIMMYGDKVPAENAALANATMARALDFEACGGGPSHACAPTVLAAFAMSERLGGVRGRDFLTACVLGIDLAYRITNSYKITLYGWDPSIVSAIFAVTAAVSKLLGFDENQMVNAFGIAFSRISSSTQSVFDDALTVRLHTGLAAKDGIFSTLLAQRGITGIKRVLQGDYGYYKMFAHGDYNPESLVAGLGEIFRNVDTPFKMYPCCYGTHVVAESAIELATKHDINPDDVAEIIIGIVKGPHVWNQFLSRPFEIGDSPQVRALFSNRYIAASSLLRRSCIVEHFTDEYIKDPKVQELVGKVSVKQVFEPDPSPWAPVSVEITMKNGQSYPIRIDYPRGTVNRPASKEEIVGKFRNNVAYSQKTKKSLPTKAATEIINLVEHMEELDNVNQIVKLVMA
jgi:2-methylcitrate dehydratase PrpD